MSKPYISLADFSKANPLVNHSSREIPLWQKGKPPYGLTIPKEQLFFGGMVLGLVKTNNLELTNTGIKPLQISSITLNGASYALPEELPKIIYPGKSVILPVSFQPNSYGTGGRKENVRASRISGSWIIARWCGVRVQRRLIG